MGLTKKSFCHHLVKKRQPFLLRERAEKCIFVLRKKITHGEDTNKTDIQGIHPKPAYIPTPIAR
jgi:hypothetical protein